MITAYLAQLAGLFQNVFFILLGFLGIGFLIGFHELGHFIFAKLFNVRVPSFSLGFGPRLISKKIGETEFCISALPFGGYVEIAGSAEIGQGEQKDALATDERSFAVKPLYQKLGIMFGGIFFNLIFAYAAMILLFFTGIPKTPFIPNTIISVVQADSAAQKGALKPGDRIISINNENVENNVQKLQQTVEPLALKEVSIVIDRGGEIITKSIIIGVKNGEPGQTGTLGVEVDFTPTPAHSFKDAVIEGIKACNSWIKKTIQGFSQLFSRKGLGKVGGPLMIISMTVKSAAIGWQIYLLLLAIISINLAVLNLIPLPILDGGQIAFYTVEAIIRRPIPHKVREYIFIATWIMFMILFVYLTAQDIMRIASPYIAPILKVFGIA